MSVAAGPAVFAGVNSEELRRVLANLVENAIRHAASAVVLAVRAEGGRAVLTGSGGLRSYALPQDAGHSHPRTRMTPPQDAGQSIGPTVRIMAPR